MCKEVFHRNVPAFTYCLMCLLQYEHMNFSVMIYTYYMKFFIDFPVNQ